MNSKDTSARIYVHINVEKKTVKPVKYRPIIGFKGDNVRLKYTKWERLTMEGKLPPNKIQLWITFKSNFNTCVLTN